MTMRIHCAATKVVLASVFLVGLGALSACTSGTSQTPAAAPPATSSPAATTVDTPPTTDAPAPAPTTPPAPVTASYDTARGDWQSGATAISAEQGKYWQQAADALTHGETTDTDPTGYTAAVTQLTELISLPDAQQTPAQNAQYHADIDALNAFFHTPGLYS